ncbi:MAG: hypothetical protein H6752_20710, partial [Candidatus Omnitrophica bacterium]|nr:hypothetical protein [Candidatus Omnitrophota bacterium]
FTIPRPSVGQCRTGLQVGDDPARGDLTVLFECCVIALCSGDNGGVFFVRNPDPGSSRDVTLLNTLVVNNADHGIRLRGLGSTDSFTLDESCVVANGSRGLLLSDDAINEPVVTIQDTLIDSAGASDPINGDGFNGTLTLNRVTLNRPGGDLIQFEAQVNGEGTYVLTDVIDGPSSDSLFRLRSNGGDLDPQNGPASITVNEGLVSDSPYRSAQAASVKAVFDGVYGGAGPISDDPQFSNVTFDNSIFANIRKWDSSTNDFLDVSNLAALTGQGNSGMDLTGGAEFGVLPRTTVTVDPTASPVPGSVYNTIKDAADNLIGGDAWGGGNDCIELSDNGVHYVDDIVDFNPLSAGATLVVRNVPGDSPVVALDPLSIPSRTFRFNDSGVITVEGITFIGAAGVDARNQGHRNFIWVEVDDAGDDITMTVSDCVFTANNGFDQPILDFSTPVPAGDLGTYGRAIQNGDDPVNGDNFDLLIENCAFAYCNEGDGAVQAFRDSPLSQNLTIRGCIFANNNGSCVRLDGVDGDTFLFENCVTTLNRDGRGLLLRPANTGVGTSLTVRDSIIDQTGASTPINIDGPLGAGTLTVERTTIARPGADYILLEGQRDGEGTIELTDIVAAPGADSLVRFVGDNLGDGDSPASLTANIGIASDKPYRGSQSTAIMAAFDSLYSGNGPIPDDPMFVNTVWDSSFAGMTAWDSSTNYFFDVNQLSFCGQGSGGSDLSGGAETHFTACVPPPGASVDDWDLYE